ncbi:carbon-monoxide dehydrogenase small subunit [Rhizobium leguminosarum]|uniref:Carbon-monoxide dehydrogenase small subunit n=1 Tax=Rhizobium leguminosarum TaxID=384 RepID=A0AAE2T0U0_RHILE|nr:MULTISPECIES: (2Fe-2S)-binding protein [Rhizobium]MBB4293849.1 carbon-monoxide dehydrogenase small subunit [Rhizobium leguminosarum]MBB4299582.1 carbon-monoxide dehydrogenase small subunit [Rhizobium leguminosarum]MBB4311019.1 carbon-monoxide dehydrogenase small subunit [Rhizobium leguminosarum]MBB4420132.1 carbon-monoxide dehydrogenase small subunit [Rhizobium leguminosarum]MBB4435137.1 carbon-monoxide dehydrogenase small subunit [Rhizobium esperanzae]
MRSHIALQINGRRHTSEIEPNTLLLDFLRWEVGLTGTKEGCGEGVCGSCTVDVDGELVRSCLTLAVQVAGKSVTTIEGMANGEKLHPLQRKFLEHGAVQCGFCSPGLIVTANALLAANPNPSEAEVRDALRGNFCRCTGYVKIIEAVLAAASEMRSNAHE